MPVYTINADSSATGVAWVNTQTVWSQTITATTATAVQTTNNTSQTNGESINSSKTGNYYSEFQCYFQFDCSSVPSTETVTSVAYQISPQAKPTPTDPNHVIDVLSYDWGGTVTTASWRSQSQLSALTKLATVTLGTFTAANAYFSFTSNGSNFNTAIKTGTGAARTRIMTVTNNAITGTDPGSTANNYVNNNYTSSATPPRLIVFTNGAMTGSASLGLTATGSASSGSTAASGSASISLSSTGTWSEPGAAAISLAETGTWSEPGAAAITLSEAGVANGAGSGTASISMSLTGSWYASALASLLLSSSGAGAAPESGAAAVALSASTNAAGDMGTVQGTLSLSAVEPLGYYSGVTLAGTVSANTPFLQLFAFGTALNWYKDVVPKWDPRFNDGAWDIIGWTAQNMKYPPPYGTSLD